MQIFAALVLALIGTICCRIYIWWMFKDYTYKTINSLARRKLLGSFFCAQLLAFSVGFLPFAIGFLGLILAIICAIISVILAIRCWLILTISIIN